MFGRGRYLSSFVPPPSRKKASPQRKKLSRAKQDQRQESQRNTKRKQIDFPPHNSLELQHRMVTLYQGRGTEPQGSVTSLWTLRKGSRGQARQRYLNNGIPQTPYGPSAKLEGIMESPGPPMDPDPTARGDNNVVWTLTLRLEGTITSSGP